MDTTKSISNQLYQVAGQIEGQALNSVVSGFSFAAAIAWMDVVRWLIPNIIKINKNGGGYFVLTALLTTIISVLVYVITSRISKQVVKPQQAMYAVSA